MAITITWDGTITDRDTISSETVWVGANKRFWKVSDKVLTPSEFVGASYVYSDGTEQAIDTFMDFGDGVVVGSERVISGAAGTYYQTDDASNYITLPSDGTYFMRNSLVGAYVKSATFPNAVPVPTITEGDFYKVINHKWVKCDAVKSNGSAWVKQEEHLYS